MPFPRKKRPELIRIRDAIIRSVLAFASEIGYGAAFTHRLALGLHPVRRSPLVDERENGA